MDPTSNAILITTAIVFGSTLLITVGLFFVVRRCYRKLVEIVKRSLY